jgi:uncharacterized damage-inducible protein DinB
MNIPYARTSFAYNAWANVRLLDASRAVRPDQFTRNLDSSFGSIRGTLVHIMAGEWKWLRFWLEEPYDEEFREDDYPDVTAIEARWLIVRADQQRFVDGLTEDQLQVMRVVRGLERPLRDTLQHLLSHSTYHRGQVATLLRQSGCVPPSTDFLVFLGDTRAVPGAG